MTIINIPIEPIPMRYSVDWDKWFNEYWGSQKVKYITLPAQQLTKGMEQGKFLDCIGTNYYKSSQLMLIMQFIKEGVIKHGDTLFFHDLWFPGIEQIKYTCDAMNLELKFMGCLHAGTYDPNDFLYQQRMGKWALHFENMLLEIVDKVFVATYYHKHLIEKGRTVNRAKLKVTGFPIKFDKINFDGEKENLVVFPHRPDPEKNPHVFTELAERLGKKHPEWKFINTRDCKNKREYYTTLEKCKIAISVSDQETWGIAMQECVGAGCLPLVPNKLSYREMYESRYKYNSIFELESLLEDRMHVFENKGEYLVHGQLKFQLDRFTISGKEAFWKITKELI